MRATHCFFCAATIVALSSAFARADGPVLVPKTNTMKVYMHYMPWFQTPQTLGGTQWGWHWTMNTRNPNIVDASGKRQIATHYYPKIGPYDSTDADVIEYHLLLMKYSGVDGVMIDWYGQYGSNTDIEELLAASDLVKDKTSNIGLKVGVVLEDRFAQNISDEQLNMNYLRDHYFNQSNYIRAGMNNSPLMYIFGPEKFESPAEWSQILPATGADPEFLTLPYQKGEAGANADGEYAWPYQDPGTTNHLSVLSSFYNSRAPLLKTVGGVAYPGFHDYYQEGGAGSTLFYIPENNGQTLSDTLNLLTPQNLPNIDMLQLATFNDFGEGTMFEPTVETGFNYLRQIQIYTGTPYNEDELQLIYQLYLARKKYAGHSQVTALLDQVSANLSLLDVISARSLLDQASPAGDYNSDGVVDLSDYNLWRSAFGASTIIFGNGADGNFNGIIDTGDYTVWRDTLGQSNAVVGGSGSGRNASAFVPEPATLWMLLAGIVSMCFRRRTAIS